MTPNQKFILELVKMVLPLVIGIHLPIPGYMKPKDK